MKVTKALPFIALLLAGSALAGDASAPPKAGLVPLDAFIQLDKFNRIKLSPTGEYYAISVPLEDRTILVVLRRSDLKQTGMFNMRGKTHVFDFWWVNDKRIVIELGEKLASFEQPVSAG
jgi:hypothetical protein